MNSLEVSAQAMHFSLSQKSGHQVTPPADENVAPRQSLGYSLLKQREGARGVAQLRGPGFSSQYTGGSQLPVSPIPGHLIPSSGLQEHQARTWYTYILTDKPSCTHNK